MNARRLHAGHSTDEWKVGGPRPIGSAACGRYAANGSCGTDCQTPLIEIGVAQWQKT
jgi:hypothetical protein